MRACVCVCVCVCVSVCIRALVEASFRKDNGLSTYFPSNSFADDSSLFESLLRDYNKLVAPSKPLTLHYGVSPVNIVDVVRITTSTHLLSPPPHRNRYWSIPKQAIDVPSLSPCSAPIHEESNQRNECIVLHGEATPTSPTRNKHGGLIAYI